MAAADYQDIKTEIWQELNNQWNNETPIAWDNVEFSPTTGSEYISVFVDPADENPVSVGSQNLYRIIGELVIPVYTEQGIGTARNDELADKVSNIFRGKDLNGKIQFSGSVHNRVGITSSGGWYRSNVRVKFTAHIRQ